MGQEWNIRSRGHECARCGRPFEEGDLCVSCLRLEDSPDHPGAQVLARLDFCSECAPPKEDDAKSVSVWRGKYRPPEPPPVDPAPRQTVESLLRRFADSEDAISNQPVIYLLAVMLERKRILLERAARPQNDGTILRFYEFRKTGEALMVTDPCLQVNQLQPVQEQIAALLQGAQAQNEAAAARQTGAAPAAMDGGSAIKTPPQEPAETPPEEANHAEAPQPEENG